jgi:hypothetical protein
MGVKNKPQKYFHQFGINMGSHGPIWAFAISWLNLLWWRVGINLVNLLVIYRFTSKRV